MKKLAALILSAAALTAGASHAASPVAQQANAASARQEVLRGNSKIVADYVDAAFNEKNAEKAARFLDGDKMIQHNPAFPNGFGVIRGYIQSPAAQSLSYERGLIMEKGDLVMVHGRYKGWNGKNMIAVDIFRVQHGKVVEHWDVMQEEVPVDKTVSGLPMFPAK